MNLFWLKDVSYALLVCAVLFYLLVRLKRLHLSRAMTLALFAAFVVLAGITFWVQERNAQANSPRLLVMGTVVSVTASRTRSGNFSDDFQLELGHARLSPQFSTYVAPIGDTGQPIHQGDVLGVLYRTWDNVPLTIDEIEGRNAGWHYRRAEAARAYLVAVAAFGSIMLIALFFMTQQQRPGPRVAQRISLGLNDD